MLADVGPGACRQKGVPGGAGGKLCLLTIVVITDIMLALNREVHP
jgi:hypothetical protein